MRIRSSVDFPAPLAPTSARTSPCCTSNETPRSAGTVSREDGMQERPPSGRRGGKILFDIFEAEREVFHRPPLYPFERRETRPTGADSPATGDIESALPNSTPDPGTISRTGRRRPNPGGRPACGIRVHPARANSPDAISLWLQEEMEDVYEPDNIRSFRRRCDQGPGILRPCR